MNLSAYEAAVVSFTAYLREQERAESTITQYLRELRLFAAWMAEEGVKQDDTESTEEQAGQGAAGSDAEGVQTEQCAAGADYAAGSDAEGMQTDLSGECAGFTVTREAVIAYKHRLQETCAPASVNTKLAALNRYFDFLGRPDLKVRPLRIQRKTYQDPARELTREEYVKLVETARREGDERLCLILETLCATGIRVSELSFLTCEAVRAGQMLVQLKGKSRVVLLPRQLCRLLKQYMKHADISHGLLFRSRSGKPLDRTVIWRMMKRLSIRAGVAPGKVFPHNLRHLFACCFYQQDRDISKLADVLGHSNLNTTRLYIISSGREHRKKIEALRLVV